MKVLIDTHIWLWYLTGDKKLSTAHRKILESDTSDVWLSSISIWETHLLIEKKRLSVTLSPSSWIGKALEAYPVKEARLSFAIATRSRTLNMNSDDPADRFIAATALENNISLMTSDKKILKCKEIQFV